MTLILQDSTTSMYIGELSSIDFVPNVGETFLFAEGTPQETQYTVTKRLYPTLIRNDEKYVRLRVRLA